MSSDPVDGLTAKDIAASIVAKSDQINADDLRGGVLVGRIVRMTKGPVDRPINIWIDTRNVPWRPCKGIRGIMAEAWGLDPKGWLGQSVTLFRDPDAPWAGEKAGGVRIKAMTGISGTRVFTMKLNAKQRVSYTIEPMVVDNAAAARANRQRLMDGLSAAGLMDAAVAEHGPDTDAWSPATCKALNARLTAATTPTEDTTP